MEPNNHRPGIFVTTMKDLQTQKIGTRSRAIAMILHDDVIQKAWNWLVRTVFKSVEK
jgi:hypothetical protein